MPAGASCAGPVLRQGGARYPLVKHATRCACSLGGRGAPQVGGVTGRFGMRDKVVRFAIGTALVLFEPEFRAWRGQLPLARVFWVHGVLTSMVMAALVVLAAEAGRRTLEQALLLLLAGYTAWIVVAVWRCAEGADPRLRTLARSLTVAWAINTAMVTVFLQFDLIAARFGA